eukprot:144994-Rhodomonas_salina.1
MLLALIDQRDIVTPDFLTACLVHTHSSAILLHTPPIACCACSAILLRLLRYPTATASLSCYTDRAMLLLHAAVPA